MTADGATVSGGAAVSGLPRVNIGSIVSVIPGRKAGPLPAPRTR